MGALRRVPRGEVGRFLITKKNGRKKKIFSGGGLLGQVPRAAKGGNGANLKGKKQGGRKKRESKINGQATGHLMSR